MRLWEVDITTPNQATSGSKCIGDYYIVEAGHRTSFRPIQQMKSTEMAVYNHDSHRACRVWPMRQIHK